MVEIQADYQGHLRCAARHPSGSALLTDAPRDNMGKGEAFSPTDLVATALGTCILTTMGIVAQRRDLDISGARITVQKEMTSTPTRRIASLAVEIHMPRRLDDEDRQRLENAAHACPVHASLHPDVKAPIVFHWGE
jgi:putative redox protein